jgi:hypothetical protein
MEILHHLPAATSTLLSTVFVSKRTFSKCSFLESSKHAMRQHRGIRGVINELSKRTIHAASSRNAICSSQKAMPLRQRQKPMPRSRAFFLQHSCCEYYREGGVKKMLAASKSHTAKDGSKVYLSSERARHGTISTHHAKARLGRSYTNGDALSTIARRQIPVRGAL